MEIQSSFFRERSVTLYTCVCMCACACSCVCACVYANACMCACMCVHMCVCVYHNVSVLPKSWMKQDHNISVLCCSSARVVTSVLPSGLTLVSTPESGCLRPLECGPPTRWENTCSHSKRKTRLLLYSELTPTHYTEKQHYNTVCVSHKYMLLFFRLPVTMVLMLPWPPSWKPWTSTCWF